MFTILIVVLASWVCIYVYICMYTCIHMCIYMLKFIQLYTLNICSLLHINYTE